MRRSILTVSLVLPALGLCAALAPTATPPPCVNIYPHEPVLMYEVSGYSLCCLIDIQMTIYGDGSVRAASADEFGIGRAQIAHVSPAELQALLTDLSAFGAGSSCDVQSFFNDVPLSTLTMLRGTTDGRARTWSWLGDDGQNGAIEQRLNQFLHATFPGF